jgi:cell division initiation protein
MRYTPVELRHVRLKRSFFGGYKRAEADVVLAEVADSFEDVWRERGELTDRLEDVEGRLEEIKQREALLATTLVAAEKTAADAIDAAKREAEIIVAEAHQEARSITRGAQTERERLFAEARRVETLLRAALGMVEESRSDQREADAGDASPAWPNREHTAEFAAISLEDALAFQAEEDAEREPDPEPEPEPRDHGVEAQATPLPPVQDSTDGEGDTPWSGRDFVWG